MTMKRNIKKICADYHELKKKKPESFGEFYYSDMVQLIEMARTQEGNEQLYEAVCRSLEAGFMIGYRCAKREQKRARKSA